MADECEFPYPVFITAPDSRAALKFCSAAARIPGVTLRSSTNTTATFIYAQFLHKSAKVTFFTKCAKSGVFPFDWVSGPPDVLGIDLEHFKPVASVVGPHHPASQVAMAQAASPEHSAVRSVDRIANLGTRFVAPRDREDLAVDLSDIMDGLRAEGRSELAICFAIIGELRNALAQRFLRPTFRFVCDRLPGVLRGE